jgi:major membrane immunogen (membrane-anchored lipoprotein)
MTPEEYQSRSLYLELQPGDRVEVVHGVTVGSSAKWSTTTVGRVLRRERRRHGLHFRRNPDDKVYSDVLILARDDGELTTVTMDEFTRLRKL